ncbi:MAG: hypothetical protein HFH01_14150 [Dorea sp.]|nr:hypothetical protein [Dorea sp.]
MDFENRFYPTDEMYKEYVYKVLCRDMVVCCIIAATVAGITMIVCMKSEPVLAIIEGVCMVVMLIVLFLAPKDTLKRMRAVNMQTDSGTYPECVVNFSDTVKMTEGKYNLEITYEQICRIFRLKSCGVLMYEKEKGILYGRDNFVEKDGEEFETFILEKCANVKHIENR